MMTDKQKEFIKLCYSTENNSIWYVPYDLWDKNIHIIKELTKAGYQFSKIYPEVDCHWFI